MEELEIYQVKGEEKKLQDCQILMKYKNSNKYNNKKSTGKHISIKDDRRESNIYDPEKFQIYNKNTKSPVTNSRKRQLPQVNRHVAK